MRTAARCANAFLCWPRNPLEFNTSPGRASEPKRQADVAQLVERNLAKVEVASSNLVVRSKEQGDLPDPLHSWWSGREARQRPAKPSTRVQIPSPPPRTISSAGERFPDTEEVTGSIPVSSTTLVGRPGPTWSTRGKAPAHGTRRESGASCCSGLIKQPGRTNRSSPKCSPMRSLCMCPRGRGCFLSPWVRVIPGAGGGAHSRLPAGDVMTAAETAVTGFRVPFVIGYSGDAVSDPLMGRPRPGGLRLTYALPRRDDCGRDVPECDTGWWRRFECSRPASNTVRRSSRTRRREGSLRACTYQLHRAGS